MGSAMSMVFYLRLLPPRPTFPQDMTDDERTLMEQHAAYSRQLFEAGQLLAYGPVFDPEGAFGIAIAQVENELALEQLIADDPSVAAGMNRYLYAPMLLGGAQAPRHEPGSES